ncbi:hypothetical protein NDN08_005799 [Rhodosorus marinus]|uniref:ATP-grasp domain-containing protein n=1 Tax=Rhodosorus marinus TaxID=101924 RepID=A0AAV8V4C2_9RHOD|nr:hypothetical protein NDN08_005799 [Rhodosorus marinus]
MEMSVDYDLDDRHLPSSQVEKIPFLHDHRGEEIFSPSSLRANFIPVGAMTADLDESKKSKYSGMFQETPLFSPVFQHLPSVKPETLTGASKEKQELRRKLVRGSNILIVQGGYSGKRFIYERLKELGIIVTILDGPDSYWKQTVDEGLIHQFVEIDFTEYESIVERSLDLLLDLDTVFDGVTSYFENAVPLAAKLATALGVQSNPVEACEKARSKSLTREVMRDYGIPVPKFYKIMNKDEVSKACDAVGFPAVLKPSFGAASFGVFRVNSAEETVSMYDSIMDSFAKDYERSDLWRQGTEMLLEEYYDGEEFDIDIILSNGEVVYNKVSDNWSCAEPWFQEQGTNCPSVYPMDRQEEIMKIAADTTLALGFLWGVFHVEVKYTSRGPRLIEVNARMGGVSVRQANLYAWGVDLVEEHIMSALKIPLSPVIPNEPLANFAQFAINTPYTGTVTGKDWLKHLEGHEFLDAVYYYKFPGDHVMGPDAQVPTFLAEVRCLTKDPKTSMTDLLKYIEESITALTPPLKADNPELPEAKENKFFFPASLFPFAEPAMR